MKKRAERGINDGGGNGKRKRWTVHFYLFTRGIRRRLARYRSFTISTEAGIRSSFERYTYRYKFVYEREKKKTRARSFYPSSLELITSSCDPLSNRLRASAGSKRCIIEETINASISSAQAIVSHDIITHARGKPEILPTENDIHIYIYIYTFANNNFFPYSVNSLGRPELDLLLFTIFPISLHDFLFLRRIVSRSYFCVSHFFILNIIPHTFTR